MKKVLIIDDEAEFCRFVKGVLDHVGYDTAVCDDSRNAFNTILSFSPDIILLDINMPNLTGDMVAAELRKYDRTKNIPIVFISVLVNESEIHNAAGTLGQNFILPKPIKVRELLQLIKTVLGGQNQA